MTRAERPSLLRPTLFALTWQFCVWVGLGAVAASLISLSPEALASMSWPLLIFAVLILAGELRPIVAGGTADTAGVPFSTAFVLAALYLWGPAPAILLQAVATAGSELLARKEVWKLVFNVGQMVLCLVAAWGVMLAVGVHPTPTTPTTGLSAGDLPWLFATWLAYHLTNLALVAGVAASDQQSWWESFHEDFWWYTFTTLAVAALSPIVVLVASLEWVFLPLLLLPLAAVWRTAEISREKEHQSLHDRLTDLPNRTMFEQRTSETLEVSARRGEGVALLLLDLDRFKEVNDTLGHAAGDRLLEVIAKRIMAAVRPEDTVARLGGDEFGLLVPGVTSAASGVSVGERVRQALHGPVHIDGHLLDVDVSLGVALYPEHGEDFDALLAHADVAMYVAKGDRSGVALYDAARDPNSPARLGAAASLRAAIDSGALFLHLQPVIGVRAGDVVAVEALARWNDPARGMVPPDQFIPLAEHAGLMPLLTQHVLRLALDAAAVWWRDGHDVPVTVNLSLRDITDDGLMVHVRRELASHGLPPQSLIIEVTERVLLSDPSRAISVLSELAGMGVRSWLDDFGTGSSSLAVLQAVPVSGLKADRLFVAPLDRRGADTVMLRSILGMAHGLGLLVVGEGVETPEAFRTLRDLGCDAAQGWHISRPMPADAAARWIHAHRADTRVAAASLRMVRPRNN